MITNCWHRFSGKKKLCILQLAYLRKLDRDYRIYKEIITEFWYFSATSTNIFLEIFQYSLLKKVRRRSQKIQVQKSTCSKVIAVVDISAQLVKNCNHCNKSKICHKMMWIESTILRLYIWYINASSAIKVYSTKQH